MSSAASASAAAGGEAVHDASVGAGAAFLGQDCRHVVIGVAGVDDQRQAGLARGLDVDAQALLLHGLALGGVVVVEAGFADADELRVAGEGDKLVHRGQRFFGGAHRVGAGGVEDARHAPRRWRGRGVRGAGGCRS